MSKLPPISLQSAYKWAISRICAGHGCFSAVIKTVKSVIWGITSGWTTSSQKLLFMFVAIDSWREVLLKVSKSTVHRFSAKTLHWRSLHRIHSVKKKFHSNHSLGIHIKWIVKTKISDDYYEILKCKSGPNWYWLLYWCTLNFWSLYLYFIINSK